MTSVIPFQDRGHGTATERRIMTFFISCPRGPTPPVRYEAEPGNKALPSMTLEERPD